MKAGFLVALVLCAQQALAERVYVTQGAFGEASFSDVALPGSQAIDLDVGDPTADEVRQSQHRAQVTAELAAELAQARHARAEVRARQRAAMKVEAPPLLAPEAAAVRYLYPFAQRPFFYRPGKAVGRGHPQRPAQGPKGPPRATPEDVSPGFQSKWIAGSAGRQ